MNIIPAKYTEVLVNLLNNKEAKDKIDQAMSTYPLYQRKSVEEYIPCYIPTREELNNKILNYYKYREIGQETFGRFLFELETALVEIMPYYNQLYFSSDQDFNITYNVDYRRTIDRNKEENTSSNSETNSETTTSTTATDETSTNSDISSYAKNVSSDTPQSSLNSYTAKQIDSVNYANNINWNHNESEDSATTSGESSTNGTTEGTNTVSNTGSGTETEGTVETTKGNFGVVSAQDLIIKYRQTILNIDQQIINDPRIQELFMLVY